MKSVAIWDVSEFPAGCVFCNLSCVASLMDLLPLLSPQACSRLYEMGISERTVNDGGQEQDQKDAKQEQMEPYKVRWRSQANGIRLPTEVEWEYACRAGTELADNEGEITVHLRRTQNKKSKTESKTEAAK